MADLFASAPITRADKLGCARRELGYRRRVYPRLVEQRKMEQDAADREIAIMAAIVADYEAAR